MNRGLLAILFLGLAIRLLLVPNPGFEADVAFWKSWSLAAADHGILWMATNTNNNYPPAFGYVLWLMGKAYALIGDPHDFNDYWSAGNFRFLLVAKSIPIVSDIIIALGIYWLLSRPNLLGYSKLMKKNLLLLKIGNWELEIPPPIVAAAAYFLHPVSILDGAWWGQVDAFGVMFLLFTLILIFTNRPGPAMFTITLGFLLKLQNLIYIPLLGLYLVRRLGRQALKPAALDVLIAWVIGTLPFLWGKEMERAIYLLGANADWFPWLSLHAYNLWWIVAGADGMGSSDKFLLWGSLSPKTIGLVLFSASYLLICLAVWLKPQPKILLLGLFTIVFSFFMLLTQSHERYIFPAFMLLPLLLPFSLINDKGEPKESGYLVIGLFGYWVILSLTAAFDLHRTLVVNYPNNGLPILSLFLNKELTLIAAFVNLGLYLAAIIILAKLAKLRYLILTASLVITGLILLNRNYLFSGKVPLTALKSTGWYQEYGGPRINMTVDSSAGPKTWQRLSSSYFFYPTGIGTHAKSEIVYELRGKFSRLSTDYGIDTEANTAASVVFQVAADDRVLFTSETLGRFDLPRHADVDIKGVNILKLVTLATDDGNRDDHADWLNPVLYK